MFQIIVIIIIGFINLGLLYRIINDIHLFYSNNFNIYISYLLSTLSVIIILFFLYILQRYIFKVLDNIISSIKYTISTEEMNFIYLLKKNGIAPDLTIKLLDYFFIDEYLSIAEIKDIRKHSLSLIKTEADFLYIYYLYLKKCNYNSQLIEKLIEEALGFDSLYKSFINENNKIQKQPFNIDWTIKILNQIDNEEETLSKSYHWLIHNIKEKIETYK